jgi:DNA-binding CsgD family transcriptional regulator
VANGADPSVPPAAASAGAGAPADEREALLAVLDCFPSGTVVVTADGAVTVMNRAAREILAALGASDGGDGVASAIEAVPLLREAVREVIDAASRRDADALRCFALRPGGSDRTLDVVVLPLGPSEGEGATPPAAAVFLFDPRQPFRPRSALVRQLYGFTASEARFAAELIGGRSVREIAALMKIEMSTARSHLKKIFAKTGTKRQGELVSLLVRGAGSLDV